MLTPNQKAKWEAETLGIDDKRVIRLIGLIIRVRRRIRLEENYRRFDVLVRKDLDYFCSVLNYRWLNSITDTYADYGTPHQKAQALLLTQFFVFTKTIDFDFDLTERTQTEMSEPSCVRMNRANRERLYKMWHKCNRVITDEPFKTIWTHVYGHIQEETTVWHEFLRYHVLPGD